MSIGGAAGGCQPLASRRRMVCRLTPCWRARALILGFDEMRDLPSVFGAAVGSLTTFWQVLSCEAIETISTSFDGQVRRGVTPFRRAAFFSHRFSVRIFKIKPHAAGCNNAPRGLRRYNGRTTRLLFDFDIDSG